MAHTTVLIGNGLYARTRATASTAPNQNICTHAKHDPRGNCYTCGKHDATKINETRLAELRAMGAIR
jgi:hypothetical protein